MYRVENSMNNFYKRQIFFPKITEKQNIKQKKNSRNTSFELENWKIQFLSHFSLTAYSKQTTCVPLSANAGMLLRWMFTMGKLKFHLF